MLACLGIWMATRTRSDGAKLAVLWWAHGWGDLFHNLLLTVPGNIVGGAIIIGLPYAFSTTFTRGASRPESAPAVPTEDRTGAMV